MTGIETRHVDPSNAEQAKAWDGDEGAYWARHADLFEESTSRYDRRMLDAVGLTATSQVIDVGCGSGDTTRAAAVVAPDGSVLAVDLSRELVDAARRRAARAGIGNARFEVGDAQVYPFEPGAADAVISKTGAMFFGDPVEAFGNLARALRPGGRMALLVWQTAAENEWFLEISTALAGGRDRPAPPPDAPGPFSLSDPDRARALLTAAGFEDVAFEGIREPMGFGRDAEAAYDFIVGLLGWMLEGLDDADRAEALGALRASLAAHETEAGVVFGSAMWLVTAVRP
jgi:SAM-dependent methyltransferase